MPDTQPGLDALIGTVEHHLSAAMTALDGDDASTARTQIVMATMALNRDRLASPATGDSRPEDHMLFHGHHPACPWTVEGDWSVCDCGASRGDSRQTSWPTPPGVSDEAWQRVLNAEVEWVGDSRQSEGLTLGEDGRYHCQGCDAHDIDGGF